MIVRADQPGAEPVRVKPEVVPNPEHTPRRRTTPAPAPTTPVREPQKVPA